MKKALAFLLAAVMVFALAACGSTTTPPATETPANTTTETNGSTGEATFEKMTLNVGHSVSTDHGYHQGLVEFKRIVEEKTGTSGLEAFQTAMENIMPAVEVKTRRVGGAN